MRILLVGYGKMGKTIEKIALDRGNTIAGIVDHKNIDELTNYSKDNCDVAIEFTRPESGFDNIQTLLKNGVPTVSGTTGWLDKWDQVVQTVNENKGTFFYASNFSVGVNVFFAINKKLAEIMNNFGDYQISMEEIHHIHKLDEPSGTAITLSEGISENVDRKSTWSLDTPKDDEIHIKAVREGEVPGTHIINYSTEIDTIEIKHEAHNRQGFALGAVLAAEWLPSQEGVKNMNDLLKI